MSRNTIQQVLGIVMERDEEVERLKHEMHQLRVEQFKEVQKLKNKINEMQFWEDLTKFAHKRDIEEWEAKHLAVISKVDRAQRKLVYLHRVLQKGARVSALCWRVRWIS